MSGKTRAVQCSYTVNLGGMNGYGQTRELAKQMEEIAKFAKFGPDGPNFKQSEIMTDTFTITWTERREFEFDQP